MARPFRVGRRTIPIIAVLGLVGCAPIAPTPPTPSLPPGPASTVEDPKAPANARQIAVTKLLSKIRRGERVGGAGVAPSCYATTPINWPRSLDEPLTGQELSVVREELKRAGYRVAGQSGALFDDPNLEPADLLLAGAIKRVTFSTCGAARTVEGDASVEIEWQLFETRTRSVVLTSTTVGAAKGAPATKAYLDAYAASTRRLLAQVDFASAVVRPAASTTAPEYPSFALAVVTVRPTRRTPELLQHDQSAVVRILKGTGHGSGVIVSAAGWVLTAAHVVAGLGPSIDVELSNGQRLSGSVLRSNPVADVALVQLPKGTYPAAPMGLSAPLKVGDPVFAVGTPLHERFSRTLTKGVVSALRPNDGRTLIQSDVVVHAGSSGGPLLDEHGRVVGLALSGAALQGLIGVGLNNFLGIDDVWRALQVEPQVTTVEAAALLGR